ncbi:methylated-DNA--[protein]-cysteine S-methyltransferase [Thiobacter aerophilum]|uniref:Methylated-DNA--[protein]-cysteine S-methyltransferase n=1 Tax=Thiobacter aerophilum TaxID=3121275 RepID=A0ABV0EDX8_9BURK
MSGHYQAVIAAPFGVLGIRTQGQCLVAIDFLPHETPLAWPREPFAARVVGEIEAYFGDPRHLFTLPMAPAGTAHQRRVWQALVGIPAGQVMTYGELARRVGSSARAVGQACGANPIPLVIPCHRVVARAGPGGFMNQSAGPALAIKDWLLRHERGAA